MRIQNIIGSTKIAILPLIAFTQAQTANINIDTLPNCSSNTCTINNDIHNDIDVNQNFTSITNNATIGTGLDAIEIKAATITTLTNNGMINGWLHLQGSNSKIGTLNNYGSMGGIKTDYYGSIGTLNNYGYIYPMVQKNSQFMNIDGMTHTTIGQYHLHINQDSTTFNSFSGYNSATNDTSHLVIEGNNSGNNNGANTIGLKLLTKDSKFVLSVGSAFNLNTDYSLDKLITNENGNRYNLKYDYQTQVEDLFQHLATQSPALFLEKNGNFFRIGVDTKSSVGNAIYKSNILSMNNLINHINTFSANSLGKDSGFALSDTKDMHQNIYLAQQNDMRKYERFYYRSEDSNLVRVSGIRAISKAQTSNGGGVIMTSSLLHL